MNPEYPLGQTSPGAVVLVLLFEIQTSLPLTSEILPSASLSLSDFCICIKLVSALSHGWGKASQLFPYGSSSSAFHSFNIQFPSVFQKSVRIFISTYFSGMCSFVGFGGKKSTSLELLSVQGSTCVNYRLAAFLLFAY